MILYRSEPDMDNISRFQKTTGVGQILDESFARCPEREAIVFGDWRITYRELQALIYRTAHCLRSLGIRATASPSSRATARRS